MPRRSGFSLVEVMVVLAVLGVILAVAVPNFVHFVRKSRIEGVAKEVLADMALVRSEVMATGIVNSRVGGFILPAGGACYTVFVAANNYDPRCDCTRPIGSVCRRQPAAEVKVHRPPAGSGITFESAPEKVWFHMLDGYMARYEEQFLTITDPHGLQLRVELKRLGTASICSPNNSVSGYEPCTMN